MTQFHRFLLFIIFSSFSSATTIYVATNGSNETGDGTEQNPFASIWTGIWATESGDTVFIASGEYYSEVITNPWMCIYSYDGWTGEEYESNNITIMGEDMNTTFIRDQSAGEIIEFGSFRNQGINCQTIDSSKITIESLTIEGNFSLHNIQYVKIKNIRSIGSFMVQNYPAELSSYYVEITNSIFENNFFLMDAGGSDDGMTFDINYSTFYNIEISGGSMEGLFNFRNSILYNHILDITETVDLEFNYCFINDDVSGIGNINGDDPLFCNVALGDFSYSESSICVGAGEDSTNIGAIGVGCGPSFGPNIEYIEDQEIFEDEPTTVEVIASGGDELTYYSESDTSSIVVYMDGSSVAIGLEANWSGTGTITVTVTNENDLSDTTSFEVVVLPVNDAPGAFNLISPLVDSLFINNDNLFDSTQFLWEESIDPDGDTIKYIFQFYFLNDGADFNIFYEDTLNNNGILLPNDFITNIIIDHHDEIFGGEWQEYFSDNPYYPVFWGVIATDGTESFGNVYICCDYPGETGAYMVVDLTGLDTNGLNYVEEISMPYRYTLRQNYPNPFNPVTTLRYDLPKDGLVKITVYDMLGNVINQLVNEVQNFGYKTVKWNATNNQGQPVSAGVYLYSVEAGDFRQTKKMILLK